MLPYRHRQKSLRLLWVLLTAGGRLPWSLSDLRLTARFLPFPPEASLLLAASGPPSFASAAIHGGFSSLSLSALFGRRVYDSPSRSKPPACCFRAAFVRFRRHPWRLFFAIAQRSLREASLRLASPARLRKSYGAVPQFPFHRPSPGKTNLHFISRLPSAQLWVYVKDMGLR